MKSFDQYIMESVKVPKGEGASFKVLGVTADADSWRNLSKNGYKFYDVSGNEVKDLGKRRSISFATIGKNSSDDAADDFDDFGVSYKKGKMTESVELTESAYTTADADTIRARDSVKSMFAKMDHKVVLTSSDSSADHANGFAINTGQLYISWDSRTGTASIKQTRAAGGKMLDTKLNVKSSDVQKVFKAFMKGK